MKGPKTASVEDYKIVTSFQAVRKTLLDERFADRLEKPLAYWALPNDRRLPLAFMARTIKDLLATPFEELSATPGIGQKKITSLVKLLTRATKDHAPGLNVGEGDPAGSGKRGRRSVKGFDPAIVSEVLWSQWKETVRQHDVGREKLGRLAPTLQALPTVIWHTPLDAYMDYTVGEIRELKTHGEKRVRVVLEVFSIVHDVLAQSGTYEHLTVRLVPQFIEPINAWAEEWLERSGSSSAAAGSSSAAAGSSSAAAGWPSAAEVAERFATPLLTQIRIDAGETIYELAAGRLGVNAPAESVRQQSKRMDVTRARVYQLLEECDKVMRVRWPEGTAVIARLAERFESERAPKEEMKLFRATVELFFPGKNKIKDDEGDD